MSRAFPLALLVLMLIISGCVGEQGRSGAAELSTTPPPQNISSQSVAESSQATPEQPPPGAPPYAARLSGRYQLCLRCHGDVKEFHTPEAIYLIDLGRGRSPRLCTVCHGQKVHEIHRSLLDEKRIICNTCHNYRGKFIKPKAREGQLLVCELCHAKGNYITIHIEGRILEDAEVDEQWITERSGHECDTCHVGAYETIHFDVLAAWRERIKELLREVESRPAQPLNISYT